MPPKYTQDVCHGLLTLPPLCAMGCSHSHPSVQNCLFFSQVAFNCVFAEQNLTVHKRPFNVHYPLQTECLIGSPQEPNASLPPVWASWGWRALPVECFLLISVNPWFHTVLTVEPKHGSEKHRVDQAPLVCGTKTRQQSALTMLVGTCWRTIKRKIKWAFR